ncbi:MAG TPA: universal stress protein [Gaiellales bacterium]|jgi:nucleotide-binding universal stress UspA family protein
MPFARIVVAIDGSRGADRALTTALELARLTGAEITALTIEGPLPAYAATIAEVDEVKRQKDRFFESVAEEARARAEQAGVAIAVEVRAGHAAELITRFAAEHGADLVVVGHKGHFLEDYVLGSTADRVAHHAPCPVMIVK